jgi:hypothetical protein
LEVFVVDVASVLSGAAFRSLIRETGLTYKPDLRPYQSSDIALRSLAIKTLYPLAKYVLEENLAQLELIRADLLGRGVDILRLPGLVELLSGSDQTFVAPPVIEEWPDEGRLIIDGLHRIWLARRYGLKRVTCVLIRNVSMPLVPLPVTWDQIREYPQGHPPPEKRAYRFDNFSDAASVDRAVEWGVTEQNFRYFFYRDFSRLGSSGIRAFPPDDEQEERA